MFKRNADEFRYRISKRMSRQMAIASPEEAWQEMLKFWSAYCQWRARHGLDVLTADTLFAKEVGCPVHKLPWVWKGEKLVCPRYPDCGCHVKDDNEPSKEVAQSLAEDRRNERTQMHMPKTVPVYGEPKGEEVGHPKKPN